MTSQIRSLPQYLPEDLDTALEFLAGFGVKNDAITEEQQESLEVAINKCYCCGYSILSCIFQPNQERMNEVIQSAKTTYAKLKDRLLENSCNILDRKKVEKAYSQAFNIYYHRNDIGNSLKRKLGEKRGSEILKPLIEAAETVEKLHHSEFHPGFIKVEIYHPVLYQMEVNLFLSTQKDQKKKKEKQQKKEQEKWVKKEDDEKNKGESTI